MATIEFPAATYRVQLSGHLTFDELRQLVDYFERLGIGALYLSPFLRAAAGSGHGYDVVDPTQLDPGLGTEEQLGELSQALRRAGLGMMIDIVPNHMGVADPHNRWWQDVLENGPGAQFAKFFDIDWNPPREGLRGKVLLPVLGDQFGKVLEERQLQLAYENERLVLKYFERALPTDPRTWTAVLGHTVEIASSRLEADAPERMELESIVTALEHLPPRTAKTAEDLQQRYRESEVTRRRLATLLSDSHEVQCALERTIIDFNGRPGDAASFDRLEAFVTDQPYRLCHWRVATDEINYRRFFDVDSLAAIRVEDPEVFQAVHEAILRFVEKRWVTALRIDHADGLHDPAQYLTNLATAVQQARAAGGKPSKKKPAGLYTVVEKILGFDESLPADWPVHGTTGYDFLNLLNGVFVDRLGGYGLRDAYTRFLGNARPFAEVLHESKRAILSSSLSAELYVLSSGLDRISEQHRWSRDFTRLSLYRALREVVACFPVYRTYIRPEEGSVREEDQKRIEFAIRVAKRRNPAMSPSFFDFIRTVLMLEHPQGLSEDSIHEREQFVYRFQQFTGPVIAKGLEDTAFYRYFPLASLNEVGSDPMLVGTSVEQFHRRTGDQAEHWPHTMLATGTHDTKRGEDLRARLNVLSECPVEPWEAAIRRWQEMNAEARQEIDGAAVPDPNEEYLIYQMLVGTWPVAGLDEAGRAEYVERIVRYIDKALRESKLHTSWLNPYEEYDQAVASFIRAILADFGSPFARDLTQFVSSIANAGFVNSLAQTLIKICAPGVPDFYQGVEFWDFNLVDPDNRRPVDFAARRERLQQFESSGEKDLSGTSDELLARWPDARLKMLLIWRVLRFRREHRKLFEGRLPSAGGRRGAEG